MIPEKSMTLILIHISIRENPWFNVGLPEYLKPLPVSEEDPFAEIDEDIVSELRKVSSIRYNVSLEWLAYAILFITTFLENGF